MTAGTRRNGTSRLGPFNRAEPGRKAQAGHDAVDGRGHDYTGRHARPRGKTARKRAGRAVPVAAAAATLAAGAAAYTLIGAGQPHSAQLNASAALPDVMASATGAGIRQANAAADGTVKVARATARASAGPGPAAKAPAKTAAPAPEPSASTASAPAATEQPQQTEQQQPQQTEQPQQTATAQAAPAAANQPAAATLSCDLSDGMLPENVTAIVSFLLANGYTGNAAAGIAGNIYQESKGDPESVGMGGGGLIGWTPLPSGFVTGDVSADLQTQLAAILTYNQEWSSYIPALNSAASPADAAYVYVTDFERAGIPAAATRETSAQDVAQACGI